MMVVDYNRDDAEANDHCSELGFNVCETSGYFWWGTTTVDYQAIKTSPAMTTTGNLTIVTTSKWKLNLKKLQHNEM